jgi:hypothetical protein
VKTALVLGLAAAAALPGGAPTPKEGFQALVLACREGKAEALEALLPAAAAGPVAGSDREKVAAWRKEFAAHLATATPRRIREGEGAAVVGYRREGSVDDYELPVVLRKDPRVDKDVWVADAPAGYLVRGRALDAANGRTPAKLALSARTVNGSYGDSGFSFAHVTKDPAQCLGRMDLWYCHNGDLHAVADGRIARVSADRLADVDGIPVGVSWKDTITPEAGGVYVVHCRRREHRDFYVKVLVGKLDRKSVSMEWSILAAGYGSPAGIQAPRPIGSKEGADGVDGLCGLNAAPSPPEPKPGTRTPEGK